MLSRFSLKLAITASIFVSGSAFADFAKPPPNRVVAQAPQAPQVEPGIRQDLPGSVAITRDTVRAALAQARSTNQGYFVAYQQAGVFPSNTFKDKSLNVWRDRDGHFCAAATIIRSSGGIALADKVAEQNNFIRLADVKQGPLMDWILTSGFTQSEIAAIQEPFMPVYREQPVVKQAMRSAEDQRLIAKYTTVTGMLNRNVESSLDAATDRLMKNPSLARLLVERTWPAGEAL